MTKRTKKEPDPAYKSALCGLGNAVDTANDWHAAGYKVKWCLAVVANDADGNPVQAVYMLGEKQDV